MGRVDPLGQQIRAVPFGGDEVEAGILGQFDAELLFWPGIADIMGPNPCLDVSHWDIQPVGGLRPRQGRCGIPLNEYGPRGFADLSRQGLRSLLDIDERV